MAAPYVLGGVSVQTLSRDGVTLTYEQAGTGEPPMVFVHGWSGDHTYFAPQVEHFQRTHRVIAVDLRGHGESGKPEQEYAMAAFADDLAWLCGQLGVRKPVVVGHSMGGNIALELAARHPEVPGAIVAVDAPIVPPAAIRDALGGLAAGLRSPGFREAARGFVEILFLPSDDPGLKTRVVAGGIASLPQHVLASAMEQIAGHDTAAAAAACAVPTLLINATAPLADVGRFRELCPQLVVGQTVGAGHFTQLIVPDQVNAMIARFLATSVPSPAASA
jgi:pimeloyl-ACP methyl ester carboxylesterase